MAMLDECLFDVDGIADFNAVYRHGTPDTLELEITAVGGSPADATRLKTAAHAAFENNVHLAAASQTQRLRLSITVSPSRNIPRRAGKRTLVEEAS
jgi:hypothetical protein